MQAGTLLCLRCKHGAVGTLPLFYCPLDCCGSVSSPWWAPPPPPPRPHRRPRVLSALLLLVMGPTGINLRLFAATYVVDELV